MAERFACLVPKSLPGEYIHACLGMTWPAHFMKTNQGINYPFECLDGLTIPIHKNSEMCAVLVSETARLEALCERERQTIEALKSFKATLLLKMFP